MYFQGNLKEYQQLEDDLADCTTNTGPALNECLEDLAGRRDISGLCSHWSSLYITALSLVESFKVMKYFQGEVRTDEADTVFAFQLRNPIDKESQV